MNSNNDFEASFSTLILSIGSSAAMSLGEAPHPETGQVEKNLQMAQFNIDLLDVLQTKTKNNLSEEENQLLSKMLNDLKIKFVEHSKTNQG
jgi:hypothetical protein